MIRVHKAKIQDCFHIVELEKKVRHEKNVGNVYENSAFIKYGFVFVAKDESKIVGAIISFIGKNNSIYVSDHVVDPHYRGLGIGESLYKRLIKKTKGSTIRGLVWPEYKESNNLHKKLRFTRVKKLKNPYGEENKNNLIYLYELKQ